MDYIEDYDYLQNWVCKIRFMLEKMKSIASESSGKCFFTIGNTTKQTDGLRPYTTPIRKVSNGVVCGVVVFTQTQGILAASIVDKFVDSVIVDAEKKLPLLLGLDPKPFINAGLPVPDLANKNNDELCPETWNLSSACFGAVNNADCFEYKSNDMTVEGLWYYLASSMKGLSGRNVAIIGGGNIGFKLAIKLVESGCNVQFVRRDKSKGQALVEAINIIKPPATKATVLYNDDPVAASTDSDAIIGCTNGKIAITSDMVRRMMPGGLLVDVGKGSISSEGVNIALEMGVNVLRYDVTSAIDGMIATVESNCETSVKMGRKALADGIVLVSGGYLGAEGDMVVDDFRKPEQIFGICDGHGDFKQTISSSEELALSKVRQQFGIEGA
ncbi:NAD(P)-binding domain-containing protein [Maridesulfovibrio frigidus]|uniref:NAD(P)-binding domain-containing protein n=1 Tax=Maridesulfovibrio frigidus TaxID=340956 RepID=UPI0004E18694|nr:NAD(P)-binding domain-containing protein [Maridesulfovibrio frigidus]